MGEPITKDERETMREDAANARHAFCRADVPRPLDALEAAEAEVVRLKAEIERTRPLVESAEAYARLLKEPDTLEAYNAEEQAQVVLMSAAAALGEASPADPAEVLRHITRTLSALMARLDGDAAIAVDVARRGLERVAERLGEASHG